jgi:hypothetical protein
MRTTIRLVMSTVLPAGRGAIVDLRLNGSIALAKRDNAVRPANAKRSDVKKILKAAALHFEELAALWEAMRGEE